MDTVDTIDTMERERIAALDPGREKCGFAVLTLDGSVLLQRVIETAKLEQEVRAAQQSYGFSVLVEGNGTTSREARARLAARRAIALDKHREAVRLLRRPDFLLELRRLDDALQEDAAVQREHSKAALLASGIECRDPFPFHGVYRIYSIHGAFPFLILSALAASTVRRTAKGALHRLSALQSPAYLHG